MLLLRKLGLKMVMNQKLRINMVEPEFKIIFEFIHSFQNYLLNTYYIPDTVSETGFSTKGYAA